MEEKFKYLDHMTDLIVEAYGYTFQELLENSAFGLVKAMFNMSNVELNHAINIIAHGHDLKSLFYDWIEKIILSIYIDKIIVKKFNSFSFSKIIMKTNNDNHNNNNNNNNNNTINNKEINTTNLKEREFLVKDLDLFQEAEKSNSNEDNPIYKIECIGNGDIIDLHKHEYKVEVKSITYHEMEIKRNQDGYYIARFLVDL